MSADRVEREITIHAPVERVWALITEPEHLGSWFGDAGAEVDLQPGGTFAITWEQHGTSQGRVVTVEPHVRFAYRWSSLPGRWGEEPTEENSTLVEFTLRPDGPSTHLRLVESGFAGLAADAAQRTEAHEGNTRGWKAELGDLEAYAARVAA